MRRLFRADLYYRLNVLPIDLPPLRERGDDVLILATHFLTKYRAHHGLPGKFLTPDALRWIESHAWPGNVRELENAINRGILLAPDKAIDAQHLDPRSAPVAADSTACIADVPFKQAKARVIEEFEKRYLLELLEACEGNVTRAAARAETERRTLGRLLQKHGIQRGAWSVG
jgi:DNA-binding NtrC family response regulator